MEITIESLIPSEINIVSRLIETEITNSYHFEGVDLSQYPHLVKEEMIEQLFRLDKYLNNFLVAKHNGSIVGTITYIPPTKPLLITQTNMKTQYQSIQELGFLYIDEKFQRQGIGTKLFIAILRKLEREGIIFSRTKCAKFPII